MRVVVRYWGYLLVALLIMTWGLIRIGPVAIAIMTFAATAYFLFQAPVWCGAVNRNGTYCRRNAAGLLRGCHLREHKWQKVKRTWAAHSWGRVTTELFPNTITGLASLGTVTSIVAGVGGIVIAIAK